MYIAQNLKKYATDRTKGYILTTEDIRGAFRERDGKDYTRETSKRVKTFLDRLGEDKV